MVSDRRPQDLERGHLTVAFIYEDGDEEVEEDAEFDDDEGDDEILGAVGMDNTYLHNQLGNRQIAISCRS